MRESRGRGARFCPADLHVYGQTYAARRVGQRVPLHVDVYGSISVPAACYQLHKRHPLSNSPLIASSSVLLLSPSSWYCISAVMLHARDHEGTEAPAGAEEKRKGGKGREREVNHETAKDV